MVKLNAAQLRKYQTSKIKNLKSKLKRNEIYIILDNVLDTYNIGSIFRLADAVSAKKIYLCGGTETPPNHRIKKASINTTEWVEWEYCESTVEAIKKVRSFDSSQFSSGLAQDDNLRSKSIRKSSNLQVVAIEQAKGSMSYDKFDYKLPLALVVGHESDGVSKEVLELCDAIIELPMYGVNISLNVMVSLGIVLYQAIKETKV